MLQLFQPRPDLKAAHIFADHLEATLDLAEELELLHLIPNEHDRAPGRDVLAGIDKVGAFVERVETIEISIAAKLELARAAARRIADADARLSSFTRLFHAGTQPLVDLWPTLADPGRRIFDSGHDPLTFLQARGVIDESLTTLEGRKYLGTGADYRLLGTVKLGDFIELCDTCLKAIDRHYHIYEDDADWEADRARTMELLRDSREEAIRVALGAAPAIIDTPVEIIASDAVDEAIELIEALTFPEEKRFQSDHPLVEDAIQLEDVPYALGPETMAEEPPIEIVEEAVPAAPQDFAGAGSPVDLAAESVIDEPQAESAAETDPGAVVPTAKPGLFGPVAAAGRSLAAILARRKAAAVADKALELAAPAATPESEAGLVDAVHVAAEPADIVGTTLHDLEPVTVDAPTATSPELDRQVETPIADAAATAQAVSGQLTAVRQRLVDVIAERAHSLPEAVAFEPSRLPPVPVAEDALLVASPVREPGKDQETATSGSDLLERTIEIAPALPPIDLPALDEQSVAHSASDVEIPAVDAGAAIGNSQPSDGALPVRSEAEGAAPMIAMAGTAGSLSAIEDIAPDTSVSEIMTNHTEEAPEKAALETSAAVATPADPEPTRRKRPRRKSRRKAAPRKRRTKKA